MGQMEDEWAELVAWEKRLEKSETELARMPMPELNKHRAEMGEYRDALASFMKRYETELKALDEQAEAT